MATVLLNSGHRMPMIGLGTWKLHPPQLETTLHKAIEIGYRHADCAAIYENQTGVGEALSQVLAKKDTFKVSREDLFITSKLWNTKHSFADVIEACKTTLKVPLKVKLLYHSLASAPNGDSLLDENGVAVVKPIPIQETWSAMEELVKMKLVRSIGVSNFTQNHLEELLASAKIKPAVNQIELHPYLSQRQLLNYCTKAGIVCVAYSPLGSGHPSLIGDPIVCRLASKEGMTPAQLLLSWGYSRGTPVIPKTANESRLKENINIRKLSDETMTELNAIKTQFRFCNPVDWWKRDCFSD